MSAFLDIASWTVPAGMPLVLLLLVLVVATFVSEDLTCIAAGLLVAQGVLPLTAAIMACLAGIFVGDVLLYLAGRTMGRGVVDRAPLKWFIRRDDLTRCAEWFEHRGAVVVLAGRFVPGTRLPTYVAAGVLHLPFLKFALLFLLAACLWTPLLVGLAANLGRAAFTYLAAYQAYALPVFIGVALCLWLLDCLIVPLFSFKGRRFLLSAWRRKTHWEFWPAWAFYPPVFVYVLWLGLRHRSPSLFTSANPAMSTGGFIGESKVDILMGLADASDYVAPFVLNPKTESSAGRASRIRAQMDSMGFDFPVVLKPNQGQRGAGVAIVRSMAEVEAYTARATWDILVQAYVPGKEFGVFYYRMPGADAGQIFSITEKRFPCVTGDGVHTLDRLILSDERAVCMARHYLNLHHEHLYDVPAKGETVQLVELGTHCRGAVFLDGAWVKTAALEAAIDRISKTYDGFFFGRYDIRTPNVDDFRNGTNFRIVELNGVTSEATHIYDPSNSLLEAYRVLMKQWRIAFEIGALNAARGTRPATVRELLRALNRFDAPA